MSKIHKPSEMEGNSYYRGRWKRVGSWRQKVTSWSHKREVQGLVGYLSLKLAFSEYIYGVICPISWHLFVVKIPACLLLLQKDALPLPWLPQRSPFQLAQCSRDEGWNLPELIWKAVTPLRKNAWHQGSRTPNQWHRQMSYLPIRWKRNTQFQITIPLFPRTSRDWKEKVSVLLRGKPVKYLEHLNTWSTRRISECT